MINLLLGLMALVGIVAFVMSHHHRILQSGGTCSNGNFTMDKMAEWCPEDRRYIDYWDW